MSKYHDLEAEACEGASADEKEEDDKPDEDDENFVRDDASELTIYSQQSTDSHRSVVNQDNQLSRSSSKLSEKLSDSQNSLQSLQNSPQNSLPSNLQNIPLSQKSSKSEDDPSYPNHKHVTQSQIARKFRETFQFANEDQSDKQFEIWFLDHLEANPVLRTITDDEFILAVKKFRIRCMQALTPNNNQVENLAKILQVSFADSKVQASLDDIYVKTKPRFLLACLNAQILARERRLLVDGMITTENIELRDIFRQINAFVLHGCDILANAIRSRDFVEKLEYTCANFYDMENPDLSKLSGLHTVLLEVFRKLKNVGYKRYREACYQQVKIALLETEDRDRFYENYECITNGTNNGGKLCYLFETRSWKKACSIKEFIHLTITKDENFSQWSHLPFASIKTMIEYLCHVVDNDFQELKPKREIRSFLNCILDFTFGKEQHVAYFAAKQPPSVVCCNHYDLEFDPDIWHANHWWHIPTPAFTKILNSQHLPENVQRMFYVMLGRLLYPLKHTPLDDFGTLPMVCGKANVGKSTIAHIVASFFQDSDVGVLSSNIEETFGLEALKDKFVWICYEVTKQWKLNRADTNSIIVGDKVSTATKHHMVGDPYIWKVAGICFGNELGNWLDVNGNMARRLFVFEFLHAILDEDYELPTKLRQELAAMLYKIQWAYRDFVMNRKTPSFWKSVPQYFRDKRQKFQTDMSPLLEFIHRSGLVYVDKGNEKLDMPYTKFFTMFKNYQKERVDKLGKEAHYTNSLVEDALTDLGVKIQQGCSKSATGKFLIGIAETAMLPPALMEERECDRFSEIGAETKEFEWNIPEKRFHNTAFSCAQGINTCQLVY